jgi:hypothetical protein
MLARKKHRSEYFQFHPMHPTFALVSGLSVLGLLAWYMAWSLE